MKKMFVLCFAMLAMSACTGKKPVDVIGCAAQKTAATVSASVVAQALTCTNTDVIMADIEKEISKAGICKSKEDSTEMAAKSVVGDMFCGPIVDSVMVLVTEQIPTTWGCDPSAQVEDLREKLTEKCKEKI